MYENQTHILGVSD